MGSGVSRVSFPNLTQSPVVGQSVFGTPTAELGSFARISAALKNLIRATHRPAVVELSVWSTLLVTPSAGKKELQTTVKNAC